MSLFDRMGQSSQQNQLQQVKQNPLGIARQAGYQIPDNLAGNPQAMVQHLIRTGQVGGQMMQRIAPLMQKLGIR